MLAAPGSWKGPGGRLSSRARGGMQPGDTPRSGSKKHFRLLTLRTVKPPARVLGGHQVCRRLLQQPERHAAASQGVGKSKGILHEKSLSRVDLH